MAEAYPPPEEEEFFKPVPEEGAQKYGERCPVCADCTDLEDKFDCDVCPACNEFFEVVVRGSRVLNCQFLGSCDVTVASGNICHFCKMSKCYCVGMNSSKVFLDAAHYEFRKRRMTAPPPPLPQPFRLNWENTQFLDCLIYMEQHYYQWLNLSREYQRLSVDDKILLKQRSYLRGTALQMMERSMFAHDVLWLHNCFYDPYACDMPPLRVVGCLILNLVVDFRDANISMDQFKLLKVKLALKDDVKIEDEHEFPGYLHQDMSTIEEHMNIHVNEGNISLRNAEDLTIISVSRLFEYSVYPDDYEFPHHRINVVREEGGAQGQA
ncbi:hepatocyte nuclear factor 4-gamma-like isoform X2 [Centruroides sculpturatus]|uniref:hepatocyte nuclear factor 4-gamma-like isoform X2 n=1 Tax=Centruroides sculpturatus TaxID=218467 RepID=UPI000C6E5F3B|nr:hepatocyte nuclear factor 4-gamma-like isoform X2 [Centruroides sculpturatus]